MNDITRSIYSVVVSTVGNLHVDTGINKVDAPNVLLCEP